LGACRVSEMALSHFMAGAEEYTADAMPEHYRGALSGQWTIKRDRLRILGDSWERYLRKCQAMADASSLPVVEQDETGGSVKTVKGIPKTRVIAAFKGLHFSTDAKWSKALADVPNWLKECMVMPGNKSESAQWNPVLIAVALLDKGIPIRSLDSVFNINLKDWLEKWREASAGERD
jgi:hypothetical protein